MANDITVLLKFITNEGLLNLVKIIYSRHRVKSIMNFGCQDV
jgi:hypothetical protein